ncbi:MAG: hypothetical protein HOH48_07190, partial [Candidatus Puniceispirillum sp.]|nr:hypothetical protein [Candidatus Puniceispirillum sp.]
MTDDITITGGDLSISTTEQQATTDALLGRVRDRIIGNAGTSEIVEGMFLKAAIDVASNLPDDGVAVSDAAIQRAIRAEAVARAKAIAAEAEARGKAIRDQYKQIISDIEQLRLKWKGSYDGSISYSLYDVVSYQGSSYLAVDNVAPN